MVNAKLPYFVKPMMASGDLISLIRSQSIYIENSRILCIFFMTYVHLHFAIDLQNDDFILLKRIFVDVLGRSSVPLLSTISGLLMVNYFGRRPWSVAVKERAVTLLWPMLFWNAGALLILGSGSGHVLNDLLALTGAPALLYLAFLRDLFVLCALTPILLLGVRKFPIATALLTFGYYLANVPTPVILRPQIAGFYMVGLYIATWGALRLPRLPVILAFVVMIAIELTIQPSAMLYDLLVRRPITAATFWVIACALPVRMKLGRATFVFFLCHGLAFQLSGSVYYRAGLLDAYMVLWLVTPLLVLLAVCAVMWLWRRCLPWVPAIVTWAVQPFMGGPPPATIPHTPHRHTGRSP
ncbi:MAG TPA: acyltransferase family protein [Sphingobium sp.]|nr:acyltransferase family protein [Sphingobium sp.]